MLAAVAPIQALALESPYAVSVALKRKKKKNVNEHICSLNEGPHYWLYRVLTGDSGLAQPP